MTRIKSARRRAAIGDWRDKAQVDHEQPCNHAKEIRFMKRSIVKF